MTDQSTACYHCGEVMRGSVPFEATIAGVSHPMCCMGCKVVAEAIDQGGLGNYYRFRSNVAVTPEPVADEYRAELKLYDQPALQQGFVHNHSDGTLQATLIIEGITCAACTWLLEQQLSRFSEVESASVNLSTHQANIRWRPGQLLLSDILERIASIGYRPHPYLPSQQDEIASRENRLAIRRLAVSGIGMMQVMMYAIALYAGAIQGMETEHRDFLRWVSFLVATPVVFYAARPFFEATWRDIKTRHLSMDVPVSIAIGGAYIASSWAMFFSSGEVYFDSVCMFTFLLLLGRFLEMRARHRTNRSGNALLSLLPASAIRLVTNEEGAEVEERISITELAVGDRVRVGPGQNVPADGLVLKGDSSVDESALTGEYMPIRKTPGDNLIAGSANIENSLMIEITDIGTETRLSAIVRLLDRAQQEKPKAAKLADQVASWFVAAVLLTAGSVFSFWYLERPDDAFWITLSVLVVTCPCALSLATPTALTTATGFLHSQGLLVTRGHVFEALNGVTHILFDKTGTLTQGKLSLEEVVSLNDFDVDQGLTLAARLEAESEHPIARVFHQNGIEAAEQLRHVTGEGVEGVIGGQRYRLGKPSFACGQNPLPAPPRPEGQWILLTGNNEPLCWFRLDDQLRSEAAATIATLQQKGYQVELLSGDAVTVVNAMAKRLGIDSAMAAATPDIKLERLQSLQQQGAQVLMVGDGINDVPVLAAANISVAMGSASDLAKTNADMVLLSGDLNQLTDALDIAAKTRTIIRENIAWALGYNLLALPLAASGFLAPWMAAIGMASSSLVVVGNALRLGRRPASKSL
ncbi:cadmium-translocating P-type ATPase [Aestuariirhabdus sp. Z084]|uniref:heavy metal translocating P-type ATPase n=1 Tax=Aestuariirhabdus haliotis TaxID=2918751 RepID=UPI00201B405B|nr:heavy metal translocating P-type ATPase [Aestuariirhabdus haliotis]MCL6415766.1 cadmium-translocating P-type ATPase [Aestuariirhabdus haliotis]MCL6419683.1 cadmium-translocating P-type ATPase [Aestuariirhabdus haliotis]